jgi:fermentation-respiration switch protein FrsA (DUF1100 family)
MTTISIPKRDIHLSGLLFKPENPLSPRGPALVIVHPSGGVKEQAATVYAKRFSELGFTTVAFDASYQGESGGEPHFLEDPNARTTDVSAVVDYLENLQDVDPTKIGVFGICAGGGYSIAATKTDYRIKAVATASMVNIGDSFRLGWEGKDLAEKHVETLKMIAGAIEAETTGKTPDYLPYVPEKTGETTPLDLAQATEYYRTPRACHPRAENKMSKRSIPLLAAFDAFYLADIYLQQPTLLIAGEKAGSLWHTTGLAKRLEGRAKTVIVPNATHMDFYDRLPAVEQAVKAAGKFFKRHLNQS